MAERTIYDLDVASEEQTVNMLDGHVAYIKFDAVYHRWYYDLYYMGEPVALGIALNPDTSPLLGFVSDSLGLTDNGDPKEEYEPYAELGGRLKLLEITE